MELKSCPFCNTEPVIEDIYPRPGLGTTLIRCPNKWCGFAKVTIHGQEESVKVWNTRAGLWISVDDKLPEKEGRYLVGFTHGKLELVYFGEDKIFHPEDPPHWHVVNYTVAHWQPITPPIGNR